MDQTIAGFLRALGADSVRVMYDPHHKWCVSAQPRHVAAVYEVEGFGDTVLEAFGDALRQYEFAIDAYDHDCNGGE